MEEDELTVLFPQLLQRRPGIAGVYVEDIAHQGYTWWLWDWRSHRSGLYSDDLPNKVFAERVARSAEKSRERDGEEVGL